MTADTDYGPVLGFGCDVCGDPQHLHVAPHCPRCSKLKPAEHVALSMRLMLERVRVARG